MTSKEKIIDRHTNIALELGNILKEIKGYDFDLDIRKNEILVTIKRKGTEEEITKQFNIL